MMTEDEYFEKAVVRQVKPLVRHFGLCWSLCKVRKETVCYLSGRRIMAGTLAYRPITNGKMRMHRIKAYAREAVRGKCNERGQQ